MKINYNYLGDRGGSIIFPYYFKDGVDTLNDLLLLKMPLDGEIRKVFANGKFYQYDKGDNSWNEIAIFNLTELDMDDIEIMAFLGI